ncbi:MAG: ribosome-associated translation inhibitor RaiA [Bacteroidaceae bacterium]|nr:ribosome-associated translation inhibitor RaiA [Bacteroidaceae bacterium]
MEIKIQAIRFEATEKLQDFIQKKVGKLGKFSDEIRKVEVSLKVVKPETAMNKEVTIRADEFYVEKVCDTFEEAIDNCMDALLRQVQKSKEKHQNR